MMDIPAELVSRGGNLDRHIVGLTWYLPETVQLVEDGILWNGQGGSVRPRADMLEAFLRLADATDDRVLAYARRWGVLGICKHELPFGLPLHTDEFCMPQRWQGWDPPRGPGGWEPIKSWRDFSRQAGALLRLAAQLHRDRKGQAEDVSTVLSTMPQSLKDTYPVVFGQPRETIEQQRGFVAAFIREWLWLGSVRLDFRWYGHGARIEFGGFGLHYGLFGALAVQLILAISRSDGVVFCSGCGEAYLPQRRPKARQRNYCADCGRPIALRDAARAYRRRRAQARDLHRAGVPLKEIVRRVDGDPTRVREWIRKRPRKKMSEGRENTQGVPGY